MVFCHDSPSTVTAIANVAICPEESVRVYSTLWIPMSSMVLLAGEVVIATGSPELSMTLDGKGKLTMAKDCPSPAGTAKLTEGVKVGGSSSVLNKQIV